MCRVGSGRPSQPRPTSVGALMALGQLYAVLREHDTQEAPRDVDHHTVLRDMLPLAVFFYLTVFIFDHWTNVSRR